MFGQGLNFGGIAGGAGGTEVSYLVIAGGGGGGGHQLLAGYGFSSGGGGAGGYRNSFFGEMTGGRGSAETPLTFLSGTTYTITVGGGGTRGNRRTYFSHSDPIAPASKGSNGGNSQISGADITTIMSTGGGGGGIGNAGASMTRSTCNGNDGGSPGGVYKGTWGYLYATGARETNPVQGGNASHCGGGAGNVNAGSTNYGTWSEGLSSSISGSSVKRGGGGNSTALFAGCDGQPSGNTSWGGGVGAGGYNLCSSRNGGNGVANKGGGGGSSADYGYGSGANFNSHGNRIPGVGSSGVVILRMPTSEYSGTQSGASVSTSGTDTILTYNGSGNYTH
jgi:hypothetical protein